MVFRWTNFKTACIFLDREVCTSIGEKNPVYSNCAWKLRTRLNTVCSVHLSKWKLMDYRIQTTGHCMDCWPYLCRELTTIKFLGHVTGAIKLPFTVLISSVHNDWFSIKYRRGCLCGGYFCGYIVGSYLNITCILDITFGEICVIITYTSMYIVVDLLVPITLPRKIVLVRY